MVIVPSMILNLKPNSCPSEGPAATVGGLLSFAGGGRYLHCGRGGPRPSPAAGTRHHRLLAALQGRQPVVQCAVARGHLQLVADVVLQALQLIALPSQLRPL